MTRMASRAMTRARAGDRDALSFLYARYADEVYGRARRIFDDHDTALDLTRRVFANLGCAPDLDGKPRDKPPGELRDKPMGGLRHVLGAIDD